ncbi:MAG: AI-2E family transporter [Clostridia bacterium]|nr:AI-2E family transporter [Clostridia bacterium]
MLKKPNKEYFRIFLTVACCILFYFLLTHYSKVAEIFAKVVKVFNPVLYGFVIAYLLNPIMKAFSRLILKIRKKEKETRGIRIGSLVMTYVFAVLVISAILLIIVPQTVDSLSALATNFSVYVTNTSEWLRGVTEKLETLPAGHYLQEGLEGVTASIKNFISGFADVMVDLVPNLISFLTGLTTTLGSLLFGMFLSIYMLFDKENLIARVKKTVYTMFRHVTADRIVLFFRDTNETVGNFINGKIMDSFIIGVLSYVIFLIARIPYAGLFAVVVGITNIIPIFGPFIGGIIDGILLLIVSPRQVILFVILIIVIQQLDGNIIGPKIIGKATGLSGLWVMIALTVGGGFFGVGGMILSVPIFTVLYRGFGKLVDSSLENSGLPSHTSYYVDYPPREETPEEKAEKKAVFRFTFLKRFFGKKKKGGDAPPAVESAAEEKPSGETDGGEEK